MKQKVIAFVLGLVAGAVWMGWVLHLDQRWGLISKFSSQPLQILFESTQWRQSNAQIRAGMTTDLQRRLQSERPSKDTAEKMLGPADYVMDNICAPGICLVYRVDFGQRFSGIPFYNKFGVIFDEKGRFQSISIWD